MYKLLDSFDIIEDSSVVVKGVQKFFSIAGSSPRSDIFLFSISLYVFLAPSQV